MINQTAFVQRNPQIFPRVEEDIYRMTDKLRTRLAGIVTGKDEEIDLNADNNVNTAGVNLLNALSNTEQMKGWLQDYFEYRDSAK